MQPAGWLSHRGTLKPYHVRHFIVCPQGTGCDPCVSAVTCGAGPDGLASSPVFVAGTVVLAALSSPMIADLCYRRS